MQNSIVIKGAREHNLKNIDVTIPRDRLIVITERSERPRRSFSEQSQSVDHPKVSFVSCHQRKAFDESGGGDERVTFFE